MVAATLLVQVPSDSSALRHAGGRAAPVMTAVRIERPPVLDGRLDDPAWQQARSVGGFTETDPQEGTSPVESTTVMIVYDDAAVYLGARLYDAEPTKISRRLGRRDDDTQSDMFYVDFDSYHDHRTAFEFAVNPAGCSARTSAASGRSSGKPRPDTPRASAIWWVCGPSPRPSASRFCPMPSAAGHTTVPFSAARSTAGTRISAAPGST